MVAAHRVNGDAEQIANYSSSTALTWRPA